jgi:pimeloyl-ACP methyl ester carboxylesterase
MVTAGSSGSGGLPKPDVQFIEAYATDGLRVIGICSAPSTPPDHVVVHVHGYGGDFYSNRFVRECHVRLPAEGISFVSFNLRYSGYLTEAYSEADVSYVGSAVVDPDGVRLDLDAVLHELNVPSAKLVLQGHSFGTNVVKCFAEDHPDIERIVFLSPSDSEGLYRDWTRQNLDVGAPEPDQDPTQLRWDLFGIVTSRQSYPLPITGETFQSLMSSRVFKAWSESAPSLDRSALVLQGEADPISMSGTTGSDEVMRRLLPDATSITIDGAGHLFSGKEMEMCDSLNAWIRGSKARS